MNKLKKDIPRFRLDLIPNTFTHICNQIGSYAQNEWDLPKDRTLLEKIVDIEEVEKLYAITNSAEQNIKLRHLLTQPLKNQDMQLRLAAIEWVVYDWGNVRGKSEKHKYWPSQLKNYESEIIEKFISKNYKDRIASWSKVLAFADSTKYAIYDARVAMSLNAILDDVGYPHSFFMPPPSSTKLSKLFTHIRQNVSSKHSGKSPVYLGYFDYMDLLDAIVEKKLYANVLEVEMSLFANYEFFAKKYASKYGLSY